MTGQATMPDPKPNMVWLRDDLRLADNPALTAAIQDGRPVVVVVWELPLEQLPLLI